MSSKTLLGWFFITKFKKDHFIINIMIVFVKLKHLLFWCRKTNSFFYMISFVGTHFFRTSPNEWLETQFVKRGAQTFSDADVLRWPAIHRRILNFSHFKPPVVTVEAWMSLLHRLWLLTCNISVWGWHLKRRLLSSTISFN